jgi:hypothetical protein
VRGIIWWIPGCWWFATGVSTGRQRVTAVDGDVEDLWVTNFSCTPQWLPTRTVVGTVEPLCFITEMPRESKEQENELWIRNRWVRRPQFMEVIGKPEDGRWCVTSSRTLERIVSLCAIVLARSNLETSFFYKCV